RHSRLLAPVPDPSSPTDAAVGISPRGTNGPVSKRGVVPLRPPPPPPSAPRITYTEREISVTWPTAASTEAAATDAVLPSHPLEPPPPAIEYTVYDATDPQPLV